MTRVFRDILLPLVIVVLNVWLAATTGLKMFYLMAAVILTLVISRLLSPRV